MSKYEEALERARRGLPIDEVFPELNESENEKIRQELLEVIKHCYEDGGYALCTDDYKKYSAYLEKQKEQKPESCDCSRDEESYTNGIHHVLMNPEAYGLIKQNPAEWSEEDEKYHRNAVGCIAYGSSTRKWLEELPKRFILKPEQEWSEEDNINLNACIQIINDAWEKAQIKELGTTKFAPHYYGDLIDWLKSLRPSWKPSKDEITAIEVALKFLLAHTSDEQLRKNVTSVLEQLKLL